ncbi:MAG: chaperone modulator CbpM, partial [Flavitalea sp.]
METNNLILVEQFCSNCDIELSFINSLLDFGLIEVIVLDDKKYISNDQIKDVEKAIRFYYELNINIEGIDVIFNLLNQIDNLQQELRIAKNKLSLYEL